MGNLVLFVFKHVAECQLQAFDAVIQLLSAFGKYLFQIGNAAA